MLTSDEYERAWTDLRRRTLVTRLVALSFLPGVVTLIVLMNGAYGDVPEQFGRWVGGTWFAAFFSACVYRRGFRCPRCRDHFFDRSSFHSGAMCVTCDLPLWASSGFNKPPMRKELTRKLVLIGGYAMHGLRRPLPC